MQNDECKMKVYPSEMIIICPQSRHHNSAFSILHSAFLFFFRGRRGRRPRRPGGMQIFLAALWKTGKRGVEDAAPYDAAIFSFR